MQHILVVGAGLSGAVYARTLAEEGHMVRVIDQRPHIAGNCYDELDEVGVRVHRYGPHLFHTSNMRVVDWLSRFTDWLPYEHRVVARLDDDRLVPMPVNATTVEAMFGHHFPDEAAVAAFLGALAEPRDPVLTAEDHLISRLGPDLTEVFFRRYTRKMWGHDLGDMAAAVVRRLHIRLDREDRYFPNDSFQALPADGYTAMFRRIFDHPNIRVELNTAFGEHMLASAMHCFNAMPIDQFFDYDMGPLPYRSIRFHTGQHSRARAPGHATINYTDTGPFTRETWWHMLPGHDTRPDAPHVLCTIEEPCDYTANRMERYYPVKSADGYHDRLYRAYKARADRISDLTFIGRCGTYQYLDMHQVVNQSLAGVQAWKLRSAA